MSRGRVWLFDTGVVLWVVAWIVIGIVVGVDLHHLDRLATTLGTSGQALDQTAHALQGLTHLPLIGANLAKIVTRISTTGHRVQANASITKANVNQLSYLLAVAIAIIPSVPVLAAYVPRRLNWRR